MQDFEKSAARAYMHPTRSCTALSLFTPSAYTTRPAFEASGQGCGSSRLSARRCRAGLWNASGRAHNAVMERLFLNLKMERAWQRDYANHGQAQADVAGYIMGFCNRPIGPSEIIRTMTGFWITLAGAMGLPSAEEVFQQPVKAGCQLPGTAPVPCGALCGGCRGVLTQPPASERPC